MSYFESFRVVITHRTWKILHCLTNNPTANNPKFPNPMTSSPFHFKYPTKKAVADTHVTTMPDHTKGPKGLIIPDHVDSGFGFRMTKQNPSMS